jgi:hypothetical protein
LRQAPTARHAAQLLCFTLLVRATIAYAAGDLCDEASLGRVRPAADGIHIVESAVEPLRTGDVALQLNGKALRRCEDLTAALDQARSAGLKALFLVRRGDETTPVVVRLEDLSVASASPTPAAPVQSSVSPPLAEIDATSASEVRQSLDELASFGRRFEAWSPAPTSRSLARQIEEFTGKYRRRIEQVPALAVIEPILGYYDTVGEILVYAEQQRVRDGRSLHRYSPALEYQSNSVVAEWLRRYPFLKESVEDTPKQVVFLTNAEIAGHWSPDEAIRLLVKRAVADAEALSARIGTARDPGTGSSTPASAPQT